MFLADEVAAPLEKYRASIMLKPIKNQIILETFVKELSFSFSRTRSKIIKMLPTMRPTKKKLVCTGNLS